MTIQIVTDFDWEEVSKIKTSSDMKGSTDYSDFILVGLIFIGPHFEVRESLKVWTMNIGVRFRPIWQERQRFFFVIYEFIRYSEYRIIPTVFVTFHKLCSTAKLTVVTVNLYQLLSDHASLNDSMVTMI